VPLIRDPLMSQGFAPTLTQGKNRRKTLEASALSQRLKDCFAAIKDPRIERTPLHQLGDILTIAILAVLAGGNGWEDMEVDGLSK
ncbi:transposase family protein, partial [Microcystis sp. BLCC-F209]